MDEDKPDKWLEAALDHLEKSHIALIEHSLALGKLLTGSMGTDKYCTPSREFSAVTSISHRLVGLCNEVREVLGRDDELEAGLEADLRSDPEVVGRWVFSPFLRNGTTPMLFVDNESDHIAELSVEDVESFLEDDATFPKIRRVLSDDDQSLDTFKRVASDWLESLNEEED